MLGRLGKRCYHWLNPTSSWTLFGLDPNYHSKYRPLELGSTYWVILWVDRKIAKLFKNQFILFQSVVLTSILLQHCLKSETLTNFENKGPTFTSVCLGCLCKLESESEFCHLCKLPICSQNCDYLEHHLNQECPVFQQAKVRHILYFST